MKNAISLLLVFSVLVLSIPITAKEKEGADLIIQRTDGTQISGELIAVKQNSLLIMERDSGVDVSVDIKEIRVILHVKKSKVWEGMGLGVLIGGGAGAGLSSIAQEWGTTTSGITVALAGVLAAALGLVIGGYIGATSGKPKTIHIQGSSDAENQRILGYLRKKARVKNAN